MFEKFLQFTHGERPNDLSPVKEVYIIEAEARTKLTFPSELKEFYREIGSGFFCKGVKDIVPPKYLINCILDPITIADLVCDKDDARRPYGGFDHGTIPVFDMGDRDYLIMNTTAENPNQVLWQSGRLMMDSFENFMNRLYEHADFFANGPGTY